MALLYRLRDSCWRRCVQRLYMLVESYATDRLRQKKACLLYPTAVLEVYTVSGDGACNGFTVSSEKDVGDVACNVCT
ncbi:MAG: hypothetical protein N4A72_17775 [Bacteroidales bacterium]|nr:hypothetical protein [Bacteroidales bacterium]